MYDWRLIRDNAAGLRYTCEQGEDIHGYGWDEYDARSGGVQTIHDEGNNIDITTTFVKIPGGTHGGSWAARIKGELRSDAPKDTKMAVYYYVAQEDEGQLEANGEGSDQGYIGEVTFTGVSKSLGEYTLLVTKGKGKHPKSDHEISESRPGDLTLVHSSQQPNDALWQAKPLLFQKLQHAAVQVQEKYGGEEDVAPPPWQVYRVPHDPGSGNSHVVQRTFEGSFEFDVIFSSASAGAALTSEAVTREINRASESFSQRFKKIFDLQAPYNKPEYQVFGKSMFSNLLGGVGYFHGEQLIDRSYAPEYEEDDDRFWEEAAEARARNKQALEGPYELYTSVPSRPFFPRGFLWDEGFHLMPIADWDTDLTLDVVKSWYNTMDEDGWIPREQILGPEARSKVPEEFQIQYPHYANPPTLFLIIEDFMEQLRKINGTDKQQRRENVGGGSEGPALHTAHLDNLELGEDYMRKLFPLLLRQYDWFRRTQKGEIKAYDREAHSSKEAYRWRGRSETHVLTSGLDDYPRPQPPHPGELHVDLMSWVGLMAKSLANIADALGMPDDARELHGQLDAIRRNLVDLHWSEAEGAFCDASIDEFEEHKLVCHKGYVSLFPFLLGLLRPDDAKLGKTLDLIADKEELWSPHGIRSLSKKDELYGTGENYWRSPVWMPMNYMVVKQLHVSRTHPSEIILH